MRRSSTLQDGIEINEAGRDDRVGRSFQRQLNNGLSAHLVKQANPGWDACRWENLRQSQDAQAKQGEVSLTIHKSLDQLETVHVPFDRTAAPCEFESCSNGGFIAAQFLGKRGKRTVLRLPLASSSKRRCPSAARCERILAPDSRRSRSRPSAGKARPDTAGSMRIASGFAMRPAGERAVTADRSFLD